MLVLVKLPYYCLGANLRRYTNIQRIQENCLNMFAHTLYLNREWGSGGDGGLGLNFVTPWSNIFVVYESWCAEKSSCVVIEVHSLKRELLQSLIVNREYTYMEEIKTLLINSFFFFLASFFSASEHKREVERHQITNKTKNGSISFIKSNFS